MKIIKNSKELAKLVNENKDLILPQEDVVIEFEPTSDEIRNVRCGDLTLKKYGERFNFNGGDFNGGDFNGWDFNGRDFKGRDFVGKKVSYWAFFNCSRSIECESIEGKRTPHHPPVCLDGRLKIVNKKGDATEEAINLLKEKGYKIVKE